MKAFQQTRLGEGEAAAPHPTVLAERLSLPSPRLRGEGAEINAEFSDAVRLDHDPDSLDRVMV
jgi:hypothetical protein